MTFRVTYFIWICFSDLIFDDTIFRLIYIFRRHHPFLANVTGRFSCGIIIRVFAQHALEEDEYFQTSEAGLRDDGCDFSTLTGALRVVLSEGGGSTEFSFHFLYV